MNARHPSRCPGPVGRREFLFVGGLALGGLTLSDVLAARAATREAPKATSVILLYLNGGPSHLETYDLKPAAPIEYRSIYRPIATAVPGMEICERFPLQAKLADKFSLVRSLNHDVGIHSDGGIVVLTGKRNTVLDPMSRSRSEHPDFGSVASKLRGLGPRAIPPYVSIPSPMYMTRPVYLGGEHAAFVVPNPTAGRAVRAQMLSAPGRDDQRLAGRRQLLDQFDGWRRALDDDTAGRLDQFRARAFEMLTSPHVAEAFDLSKEDARLRDRYGQHAWGQGCLLARRLAEAGAAVVTLNINTPKNGEEFTNWDDHIQNAGRPGHFGKYMDVRLPYLDEALSALIEDIFARGLERRIMVVVTGEFGRTPRLSKNANGVGRDHWPQAYTALVSGGGLRMGQVVGATSAKGEYPTERPYAPQDLLATIYRHLGIDWHTAFIDYAGRPVAILPQGRVIEELVA
jgi:uncharacterized protein (DUF1501 family)